MKPGAVLPPSEAPRALWIGPRNATAVTGQSWRWCRDHARAWGIAILRVDQKPLIPVDAFQNALEAHAERSEAADDATELETLRRQLGKRRITISPAPSRAISAETAPRAVGLPHGLPTEAAS